MIACRHTNWTTLAVGTHAAAPTVHTIRAFFVLLVSFISVATCTAQIGSVDDSGPGALIGADNSMSTADLADRTSREATRKAISSGSLSTSELISVLDQQPQALIEVRSLVAARMAQTDHPLQEEDITDQVLYTTLANSTELQDSVTNLLRTRGYLNPLEPDMMQRPPQGRLESTRIMNAPPLPRWEDYSSLPAGDFERTVITSPNSGLPRTNASPSEPAVESSTSEPRVLRQPTPYNLQALRDLYTQIPSPSVALRRFGSELFAANLRNTMNAASTPASLDVPLGPDYVLGSGDSLLLRIWGSATQTYPITIDKDGRVLLPEAGSIALAGMTLSQAHDLVEAAMQQQFRNAHVSLTVARLRSVRVYVVGDVQRPGGYDVSPLSTPLSVLYAAGGPTAAGSLRTVRILRGSLTVREIDLYELFIHGVRTEAGHFQSGDTILVPPRGPQVAISGSVIRPAIYELCSPEDTLSSLIDTAGGTTPAAALDHITIERIDAHRGRETSTVDGSSFSSFKIHDGDRVTISSILPYSERAIYLEGHVVRPGRMPWVDGMHLSDVLHSYRDMLPEPDMHGEIIRLVPPDLHAETINFDVEQILIGNDNFDLQPFDTVRIRGRYDFDAPKVTVNGEVLRPGTFPLSKDMTVAQLVRVAGGFKRDAYLESADLTSYSVVDGKRVISNLSPVHIGAAVDGSDPHANVALKPGDILTVHQVTGWSQIGEAVNLEGQVAYPGSYGLREGERLSSVLRRAGGFRDTAYPEGAVVVREEVRELEEKSRQELIRQIETSSAAARLSPGLASGDAAATLQLVNAQQQEILSRLKAHPPSGRLVIHIGRDIDTWANTPADIELRRGDVITVPNRPGFVLVSGQVYNPTALTFTPGKSAGWYLSHAGGASSTANRKEIFVIRANGSVIGRRSAGFFGGDVLSTKLNPGDVVVVPQKVIGASQLWKNLMTAAQLASSISITAAVAAL